MKEPLTSLTDIYFECLARQMHYDVFATYGSAVDAETGKPLFKEPLDVSICRDCPYCLGEDVLKDHHDRNSQTCIFERVFSGDKPYLWNLDEMEYLYGESKAKEA